MYIYIFLVFQANFQQSEYYDSFTYPNRHSNNKEHNIYCSSEYESDYFEEELHTYIVCHLKDEIYSKKNIT